MIDQIDKDLIKTPDIAPRFSGLAVSGRLLTGPNLFGPSLFGPNLFGSSLFAICLFALSACGTATTNSGSVPSAYGQSDLNPSSETGQFLPLSDGLSSNYLMARQAVYRNDLPSATDFFTNALLLDDADQALLRQSFLTQYQSGNIEKAADIARRMESLNFSIPLAQEPALIEAALNNDWDAVIALSDLLAQADTSVVIAAIAKSWSLLAQDHFGAAVAQMTDLARLLENDVGISPAFMEVQIIHLLEAAGKTNEARNQLLNLRAIDSYAPHVQLSMAAAFHRMGDANTARVIITNHLSPSFDKASIAAAFDDGSHHLLAPMTIRRGLSQSLLDTSWLDGQKSIRSLLLARAHLSLNLYPDFDAAHFVIAQEYLNLNQLQTAQRHLDAITQKSAYYLPAQLALISFYRRDERSSDALALARALSDNRPDNERLLLVISDILRSIDRCGEAVPVYQALLGSQFDNARLHRNLAICLERTEQNEQAEAYFLSSLDLDPNDAYTLNYLGYWYADENRNLDDAIRYIEKAVELRPSSGYFADSLGWVHYRMGDYDKAILWLEKAIQLEPLDPVIIEHLGDAYWRVGRTLEAGYKWNHALQQTTEIEMMMRLQDKLQAASDDGQDPLAYEAF